MSNATGQVPTALLLEMLNTTPKSFRRIVYFIRSYMGRIDASVLMGGEGRVVYINQAYLRGVKRRKFGPRRALVIFLTDGENYRSLVINPQVRACASRLLRDMINPGSLVVVQNRYLYNRILANSSYGPAWVKKLGVPKLVEDDLFTSSAAAYWTSCQRWLSGSAKHVDLQRAQGMLDELAFKYSRRKFPERIYNDLLANLVRRALP